MRECQGLLQEPPPPHTSHFSLSWGEEWAFGNAGVWVFIGTQTHQLSPSYYWPDSSVHKMNNLPKSTCKCLFIIHYLMNWDRSNSPLCWNPPGLNLSRLGLVSHSLSEWREPFLSGHVAWPGLVPFEVCVGGRELGKTDWWMSGDSISITAQVYWVPGDEVLQRNCQRMTGIGSQCVLRKCIIIFSIHLHRT